jgi:hypothetical protein
VYASLATALHLNNSHLIRTSKRFLVALREIRTAPVSIAGDAKRAFYTSEIARSIHGCDHAHFIDRDLRGDLWLIESALSDQQCPKSCPIALLIPRVPSGLRAATPASMPQGGYCLEAAFWWYLEWSLPIQTRTLRHVKSHRDPSLISINALEYASQLIMMLGCHRHYLNTLTSRSDAHPIYLLECDNTAGESWLNKGCTSSPTGRELARLQATILLDHGAGFHFGRIDTKSNVIAGGISWIPSESSLSKIFQSYSHRPPACLAVGASSPMPTSSH